MEAEVNNTNVHSIIRSNNTESLKDWFKMVEMKPEGFYQLLGDAYEDLHLKNVPLSADMQFEVERRLAELQFVAQNYKSPVDDFKTFQSMKEQLDFTCELIVLFLSKYRNGEANISLIFVHDAKFVALHISVLKRRLDFTYMKIPWEEMEFCLILLILVITKSKEMELTNDLVIDKERVLNQLYYFSEELKELQSWVNEEAAHNPGANVFKAIRNKFTVLYRDDELLKKHTSSRSAFQQVILKNSPQFADLYTDFLLLRDIYSLNRIKHYLDTALSVNLDTDPIVGSLVIQRTLQVVGEYLKNERESPNISDGLYNTLIKLVALNLRSTFINLRDMLSHPETLNKRLELEEATNRNVFKNIQLDFKTVNAEIVRILYKRKIDGLKAFLINLTHCINIEEVHVIIQKISISKLDELQSKEKPNLSHLKDLIQIFWAKVKGDIADDKAIEVIIDALNKYERQVKEVTSTYIKSVKTIFYMSKSRVLCDVHNGARSCLGFLSDTDPKGIFEQGIFALLHAVYVEFKKSKGLDPDDTLSTDQNLLEVTRIMIKIHNILKWDLQRVLWLEGMENSLNAEKPENHDWEEHVQELFENVKKQLDSNGTIFWNEVTKEKTKHLSKVNLLKNVKESNFVDHLNMIDMDSKLRGAIFNCHRKKKYKETETRIKQSIPDSYQSLLNNLTGKKDKKEIFPLVDYFTNLHKFYSGLQIDEKLVNEITRIITNITMQKINLDYCKRLATLKKVSSSVNDFKTIELDNITAAALEILILDLTEYIEKTGCLENNRTFMLEKLPILNGKQLRNHLAHENILTHILPYNTYVPLLVYAQGLLDLGDKVIIQRGTWTIGFKVMADKEDSRKYIAKSQSIVQRQVDLFHSIDDGRFDDTLQLIRQGADVYARDVNSKTVLDHSVKNDNHRCTAYLITNRKKGNIFQIVSPYVVLKNYETFSYFLNNTDLDLNFMAENDLSLLHIAAELGQLKIVEYLLKHMKKTENRTISGETALHLAAKNGFFDIVLSLLEHNGDSIDMKTHDGVTALHLAAENGHISIVDELIRRKADISLMTFEARTAFQLAARSGHANIVNHFLNSHRSALSLLEKIEALFHASRYGRTDIVGILLNEGIDVNAKTNNGSFALYVAAAFGYTNVVTMLLESGAKIDEDFNGITPLHLASQYGYVDIVKILLEKKANIDARDNCMWTPLHYAVRNNHLEIIDLLISKVVTINPVDINGLTPFHIAAELGSIPLVELLLPRSDINILTEKTKWSALHLAAGQGHVDMVNYLLNNGAKKNCQAADKSTPLHWAIQRFGYADIVTTLIQHEASVNLQDCNGATPLHAAVVNLNKDIVDILLKSKADVKITNNTLYTPLHLAAMYWDRNVAQSLLTKMDEVNIPGHLLETPLHIVATHGCTEIANMLLEKGAKCNVMNNNQLTPLHLAAYDGHLQIVKSLILTYGAEINQNDYLNRSPLYMAIHKGHAVIALFLIQNGADMTKRINNDISILSSSIMHGMTNVVSEVIKSRIDINEPYGLNQITPLIMSLLAGHEPIALLLLEQDVIDIFASTKSGWTALHVACGKGFKTCVDKILTFTQDVNVVTSKQETSLFFASEKGHEDIVRLLLNHRANVDLIANSAHPTALSCAVRNGHQNVVATLIEHNADVNVRCNRQTTPLHIAILAGYTEMALIILKCGRTDIKATTDNKWNALHFAALKGNSIVMSMLLERDVSDILNATTDKGETALHCAASGTYIEIVTLLLGSDADTTVRNMEGLTAEDIASKNGRIDIVNLLNRGNN